ncbi:MAG: hypothetical protein IPK85_04520 [Gemmatimonadetes bacterium]|nr:hypothetical protein [Gemmatimonadota bacterium]
MSLLTRAVQWIRRRERNRELRASYRREAESAKSLDARVAHHVRHLDLYWGRLRGALAGVAPQALVTSDLFATIIVGTEVASHDVRTASRQSGAGRLEALWREYQDCLRSIDNSGHDLRTRIDSAFDAFRKAADAVRS